MNEQQRQRQLARIREAIAECDRQHSAQEQARASAALALPVAARQSDAFMDEPGFRLLRGYETSVTVL